MPPTHYQASQLSSQVLVTNNQINIQQYNHEDIVVVGDDHQLSSKVSNTNDQMSVQLSNNKDIVVEGHHQSSSKALNTNEQPSFDEQINEYIQKHIKDLATISVRKSLVNKESSPVAWLRDQKTEKVLQQ